MPKGQPKRKRVNKPELIKIPKKSRDPISFETELFTWRVHHKYIDCDHGILGWDKVSILECIQVIIPQLHSYEGLTWNQIKTKPHCHTWELDKLPKDFYARLQERSLDIDELFQISLGSKPRLLGYKDGKIFYLIWYDPNHQFWPTAAT